MPRSPKVLLAPTLILLAGTAQCGSTSDAPAGQVLLYIDTDAPSASLASEGREHLTEASVDTLRIDVLGPDNKVVDSRDVAAPDETDWPVSFGVQGVAGAAVSRIRLRAFRSQRANVTTDGETRVLEPIAGFTIDRVIEVPVPPEKGVLALRVVLRSDCRAERPDFTRRTTCIDKDRIEGGFRDDLQVVATEVRPAREPSWWPTDPERCHGRKDCKPPDCSALDCQDRVCIPGGFFMLGNLRVVGFGTSRDAVPPHPVVMKPFCIDQQEFSLRRYKDKSLPMPIGAGEFDPNGKQLCTWADDAYSDDAPMNCISQEEAKLACEAHDGRLPTEAEWEYVATGLGRGTLFPWGDDPPTCERSALERQETFFQFFPECKNLGIIDASCEKNCVRMGDAVSVWGEKEVWQMGGSLSEWTLDSFTEYWQTLRETNCWQRQGLIMHPVCKLKGREGSPNETVTVRGGNFIDPLAHAYAALRRGERISTRSPQIGFRCVYPGKPEDPIEPLPKPDGPGSSGGGEEEPGGGEEPNAGPETGGSP
jgi:formylglycine-generating enzyme required for sulfatase activity